MDHFLTMAEQTTASLELLLQRAAAFKAGTDKAQFPGRTLALLFEKPSLRTRVSFELAMRKMGGHCLYLSPAEVGLGQRESVKDVALVLSRFVDVIAARTFLHATVDALAEHGSVPVVNALTDEEHPCQAIADVLTVLQRHPSVKGLTMTYIGDGNNCAISLLYAWALLGGHYRIASPAGYELPAAAVEQANRMCAASGGSLTLLRDPLEAARGAHALYTDVWTSMGQEAEREQRLREFKGYQINEATLEAAAPGAIILHPLPAHAGEEVAEDIIYTPNSLVFDEAENRLYAQQAVLATLLESRRA